jgi:hypothetical protein
MLDLAQVRLAETGLRCQQDVFGLPMMSSSCTPASASSRNTSCSLQ